MLELQTRLLQKPGKETRVPSVTDQSDHLDRAIVPKVKKFKVGPLFVRLTDSDVVDLDMEEYVLKNKPKMPKDAPKDIENMDQHTKNEKFNSTFYKEYKSDSSLVTRMLGRQTTITKTVNTIKNRQFFAQQKSERQAADRQRMKERTEQISSQIASTDFYKCLSYADQANVQQLVKYNALKPFEGKQKRDVVWSH